MSALIIKTEGVINNPKYGKMPDLVSDLRFVLDARDLNLEDGASVTRWASVKGEGLTSEKVFDQKFEAYNYPKFKNTTVPTVEFYGSEILSNSNDDNHFVGTCTYIIVCRVDEMTPASTTYSRVFSGDIADTIDGVPSYQFHYLRPEAGRMNFTTSKRDDEDTGSVSGVKFDVNTGFWVAVIVADGANSKLVTSTDRVIKRQALAAGYQDQIFLGGSGSKTTNPTKDSFKGAVSYFAQYERALTDEEMIIAVDAIASEFNL